MEELPGCVHGDVEGCDFDFVGIFVKQCAVVLFIVNNSSFFFWLQSLFRSGSSGLCGFSFLRVAMVFLSFCISSLRPVAVVVGFGCACFGLSGVFGVCVCSFDC